MKSAISVIVASLIGALAMWGIVPLLGGFIVWDFSPERWSIPEWSSGARLCFVTWIILVITVSLMYQDRRVTWR